MECANYRDGKEVVKKIYYKIVPFFSSILFGTIFLYLSFCVSEKLQNFVQGISASLIAIPFVFWGYEFVRNISQKKLKCELFEMAKMQIDTELLGVLHVFYKIFFPLDTGTDLILLERMIHTKREALRRHLSANKFLGFQVKKSFIITLQKIDAILQNGYLLKYIDDDQILALVKLYKTINSWNAFISKMGNEECFICSGESSDEYRIVSSGEKSNRLLLLKKKSETTGIVCDFGDFEKAF